MKMFARTISTFVTCLLLALPLLAAIPTRRSSDNGVDSSAQFWAMFGPTEVRTLTKGTTMVNYKQQVVCLNQQVTNATNPSDSIHNGACEDGAYLFIYQLRSSATNVTVQLGSLVGFDGVDPHFGVVVCDPTNTLELCTTVTPTQPLPAVTFTAGAGNTTASFTIPNFPKFPNGTRHQGQGLTIYVITQQKNAQNLPAPQPIALPTITLK